MRCSLLPNLRSEWVLEDPQPRLWLAVGRRPLLLTDSTALHCYCTDSTAQHCYCTDSTALQLYKQHCTALQLYKQHCTATVQTALHCNCTNSTAQHCYCTNSTALHCYCTNSTAQHCYCTNSTAQHCYCTNSTALQLYKQHCTATVQTALHCNLSCSQEMKWWVFVAVNVNRLLSSEICKDRKTVTELSNAVQTFSSSNVNCEMCFNFLPAFQFICQVATRFWVRFQDIGRRRS